MFGAQMPVGVGFDLQAKLAVAQFGLKAEAAATVALGAYLDCRGPTGCEPDFEASFEPTLTFEPIWPSVDEQFRLEMMLYPFSFADVQLGSSLLKSLPWLKDALKIKLLRGRFGVEQTLDLATITAQASNPTYGSTIATRLRSDLRIGEEIPLLEKFEKLLKISIKPIVFTLPKVDLWLSPTGTITVDPDVVRPRGTGDDVGELATFTVTIQETSTFGLVAVPVDTIELRWRRPMTGGGFEYAPGRGACFLLARAGNQTTFTCEADFTDEHLGPQSFHAFAQVRLFGVPVPVPLELGSNAQATVTVRDAAPPSRVLAAGQFHSLFATPTGGGQSWGFGDWGQLGTGGYTDRSSSGPVSGLANVVGVAAGRFVSFAVLASGTVRSWGTGSRLGHGKGFFDPPFCGEPDPDDPADTGINCEPQPVATMDLNGVDRVVIGASGETALALHADGSLSSWGNRTQGLLGRNTTAEVAPDCDTLGCPVPRKVTALSTATIVDVAASATHVLAVGLAGRVVAWGLNRSLQLGLDAGTDARAFPTLVPGFPEGTFIIAVAAGGDGENVSTYEAGFSVALDDQGRVWTWGANNVGQLGSAPGADRGTPELVAGISDVVAIAAGTDHVLALTRDGELFGWGGNAFGQVGDDSNVSVIATPTVLLAEVDAFDPGTRHSLARTRDGALWAWGRNDYGQLGDGTTTTRRGPVQIAPPTAP